jgi:hypothetical protein
MDKCDKVNLFKLQGQYLLFIVENNTELNILEHIEECPRCRETIIKSVEEDKPLPDYGNLFQRNINDQSVPQIIDYKKTENFVDARIQWRKRKIKELIKNAEMELQDIESRL